MVCTAVQISSPFASAPLGRSGNYPRSVARYLVARDKVNQGVAVLLMSVAAARHALELAGIGVRELATIDLYSCFPVAVFTICEGLGLAPEDPRGLTVTGGLPFFGGPGNNYSMSPRNAVHSGAIAERGEGSCGRRIWTLVCTRV